MKEASYEDAVLLAEQLNLRRDDVWRIIRGVRYSTLAELGLVVHEALKSYTPVSPGPREKQQGGE
ncbi:MAG: hypothetical protein WBD30_12790 [Bacteroidota bacterium]|jgi:hypothetical protein